MDNFSTFCNRFTVQRVTLMLSKFLHVVFTVLFVLLFCLFLLLCLSPKCNLSETFTRYVRYTGEVGNTTIDCRLADYYCFLNRCTKKIEILAPV